MGALEEGRETQSYTLNMRLSGVDDDNLAIALGEKYQGRDCRVWRGFLDDQHCLIDAPQLAFRGRMDTQTVDFESGVIDLSVISRFSDWNRSRVRRFTNEDQQTEYPGDKGLEFVSQMVEKQIVWGQ